MYDAAWFESLAQYRTFNERALWAILAHLDRPTSYLDVGCGDGWMVRAARRAGCNPSIGIECSQDAKRIAGKWARIVVHDVTKPITLRWQFELVSSIEVAEHLQPEGSEAYIGNLVRHTSKWLVFTAAIPGQGGDGHINCQRNKH